MMMNETTLTNRLAATLLPVEPRPEFVRDLRAQLVERARAAVGEAPRLALPHFSVPAPVIWVAAVVGAVLSVLGVIAMLRHRPSAPQTRLAH
jgi:hypothetical protein